MGQVNRVDSANLSVERANTLADGANRTKGAVAASDAFFPFADGAEILINAGVKAIVQPGGSIRDEEVFEAARKAGVTMYVTGIPTLLPLSSVEASTGKLGGRCGAINDVASETIRWFRDRHVLLL